MEITRRGWEGGWEDKKEGERERGHRGGCYIQDDEN